MGPAEAQGSEGDMRELSIWVAGSLVLIVAVPMLVIFAVLPPDLRAEGLATLAAVPAVEYLAVSVGIGLGVDPVSSYLLTVLPTTGICMLILGLLGHVGDRSPRARRFQGSVQRRIEKYPRLKRYGVVSNFFFVMVTGMYIAPGIAWFLGWPRRASLLWMALGIASITALIGLGTVGIVGLFFA